VKVFFCLNDSQPVEKRAQAAQDVAPNFADSKKSREIREVGRSVFVGTAAADG
jgi:hypothetical protein